MSSQDSGDGNEDYELASYNGSFSEEYLGESEFDGGSYGESDDDYGDSNINDKFESKFGPLKHFALNVHTGKYDTEIDLELRSEVIDANDRNRREIDPAELDARRAFTVENLKSQLIH
jgi:hypothetical protein